MLDMIWRMILVIMVIVYIFYYIINIKNKKLDIWSLLYIPGFVAWLYLLKHTW